MDSSLEETAFSAGFAAGLGWLNELTVAGLLKEAADDERQLQASRELFDFYVVTSELVKTGQDTDLISRIREMVDNLK